MYVLTYIIFEISRNDDYYRSNERKNSKSPVRDDIYENFYDLWPKEWRTFKKDFSVNVRMKHAAEVNCLNP